MRHTVPNLVLFAAALLGAALIGVGCGGGGGSGGGPSTGGQQATNADLLWSVAKLKAEMAKKGDLLILDCRKKIPDTTGKSGVSGTSLGETYLPYEVEHIDGSYWLDMFVFGDPYPTAAGVQDNINAELSTLGITANTTICLYDTGIANPQGKVFFQLERQGLTDVHILDGGLPNWIKVGEPVTDVVPAPRTPSGFVGNIDDRSYCEIPRMKEIFDEIFTGGPNAGDYTMTDFREGPLYYGHKICPDAIRHGHMPNCGFLCWQDYFDSSTGLLKSPATLEALSIGAGMIRGKTNVII